MVRVRMVAPIVNLRNHRAGVHVHGVVALHQAFDLPQGQPSEIFAQFHIGAAFVQHQQIAVTLAQKPRSLFRLVSVNQNPAFALTAEIIQIPGLFSTVYL